LPIPHRQNRTTTSQQIKLDRLIRTSDADQFAQVTHAELQQRCELFYEMLVDLFDAALGRDGACQS
jgi:hypothetical protein